MRVSAFANGTLGRTDQSIIPTFTLDHSGIARTSMWQLDVLSRVVPAFGALAKDFNERESQDSDIRLRDAQECYGDLLLIGQAIYTSRGEWAAGLEDIDITKLLAALETRFPTRRNFPIAFSAWKSREVCCYFPEVQLFQHKITCYPGSKHLCWCQYPIPTAGCPCKLSRCGGLGWVQRVLRNFEPNSREPQQISIYSRSRCQAFPQKRKARLRQTREVLETNTSGSDTYAGHLLCRRP